jgi:hypothetical protein
MDMRQSILAFFNPGKAPSCRRMFCRDEDARLRVLVARYGDDNWSVVSEEMHSRSPRQCRERYKNYLSPHLSTQPWAESEDALICEKYREIGPRWAQMATDFVGRSDVAIKNRWAAICARGGPPGKIEGDGTPDKSVKSFGNGEDAVAGDPSEFSIARLLWNPGDSGAPMKTEIAREADRRDGALRGFLPSIARMVE